MMQRMGRTDFANDGSLVGFYKNWFRDFFNFIEEGLPLQFKPLRYKVRQWKFGLRVRMGSFLGGFI